MACAAANASAQASCYGSFFAVFDGNCRLWWEVPALHAVTCACMRHSAICIHTLKIHIRFRVFSNGSYFGLLSTCLLLHVPSMTWTESAVPDMPQVPRPTDFFAATFFASFLLADVTRVAMSQARSSGGMAEVTLAKGKALLVVGGWTCDSGQSCGYCASICV